MYKIIDKKVLNDTVVKMIVEAPMIAKKALPGQFIILRCSQNGERIPLTIYDYNRDEGTISIIFQIVGLTTKKLSLLEIGDCLIDCVGPLGKPSDINNIEKALVIGGGVGCAIAFPIAKELYMLKKEVDVIVGFRNKDVVILDDEFSKITSNFYRMSDDGTYGEKGLVTKKLEELLKAHKYDKVIAIGPLPMMKYVSIICEKYHVPIVVSMNSIMIDGTGMCGCCRLSVDGCMKFACVDGPEFDGTKVDFDEAIQRSAMYKKVEREKYCHLMEKIDE